MSTDRSAADASAAGRTRNSRSFGMIAGAGALILLLAWARPWGIPFAQSRSVIDASPGAPAAVPIPPEPPAAPVTPVVPATISWTPSSPVEGSIFSVRIEGGDPAVRAATGRFGGQPLHFGPGEDGALIALAAAPLDSIGNRELRVELTLLDGRLDPRTLELPVGRGDYAMERLTVAPEFGQPQPPEIEQRIARESARALEVSRRSHTTPRMWEPPFVAPRESRITSGFGHGRTFNGQVQSRHTGTDFAGAVGAPVLAPARGLVALVGDFYLGGGVIYLDHGAGLVTAYLHLSAQLVEEGEVVEPGQTIGHVGATGRVTGPHLHWIVRYGPHSVDGLSLLGHPGDTR